jgi:mono/diheme cytochrome c family protein
MRLALAIASAVILIVHGIVFYDQFFNKWERHQTAYFEQAKTRTKNEAERAELEARRPAIEQIIVTQFGESRVDRCITCHIAADDPRFTDHFEPLKTHPYSAALGDVQRNGRWERRHKFADFGCTVCHDGQGRGLETEYAHGEDHFWPDPLAGYVTQATWRKDFQKVLVGREYMEANCALCHTDDNFAGTPTVNKGKQLFFSKNCYGCHRIDGLSDGALAPDLTEVGRRFKVDYLWESIVEPRANLATSFMPAFRLTPDEVKAIVVFLKSRRGINFNETSIQRYRAKVEAAAVPPVGGSAATAAATAADQRVMGETYVKSRACAACHKVGAEDGLIAPDLTFVGLLKEPAWIDAHFRNPRALVPASIMPAFRFDEPEFAAMTAYLSGLTTPPALGAPADNFKALCARCHGEKGDGNGPIALYLDPSPRDLTKAAFMNSKAPERFVASIRDGVGGTSMPAWGKVLDDTQARALVDYVYATFVKEKRRSTRKLDAPAANPVASAPESIARGEKTYLARCTGCHGRKADGKGPNSTDILPRPRNLRNAPFLQQVSDQRLFQSILYGVQGTAMPPWVDYGLTRNDVGDLVNYIRSLNTRR